MSIIANDTETGGLYPAIHALLSIGAVCLWDGSEYHAYITAESQPGKIIDPGAVRKNGYSREKWESRGSRPLDVVFAEFTGWLAARFSERPAALMLCHNAAFDRSFYAEAERLTGHTMPGRGSWVCSQMKMNEMLQRGTISGASSSLDCLAKLSAWPHARAEDHDALEDSCITLHGYQWLLKKQQESEETLRAFYTESLKARRRLELLIAKLAMLQFGDPDWTQAPSKDEIEFALQILAAQKKEAPAKP